MNTEKPINVLSLFNGLSCGHLALDKIGVQVETYYSSEIDKHAIQVCQHNYPNTIQLGDVTKWREWDIDWSKIDLLLAGSPCQGFSFAGKQLAFDDPRSKLFFVFVDILNHIKSVNPNVKWLLENVRMKKEHEYVISKTVGIEPVIINSSLLSAQNRVRLYWTNFHTETVGIFGIEKCAIPQPKDLGIMLKDVLEAKVDEKYYLSNKTIKTVFKKFDNYTPTGKSPTLTRQLVHGTGRDFTSSISKEIYATKVPHNHLQNPVNDYGVVREVEKSLCIDANYHKGMDSHAARTQVMETGSIKFGRTAEAKKIRKENMKNGFDHTPFADKEINGIDFEKMNTVTAATTKDNLVIQINPSKESGGKQPYQQNRVYNTEGKALRIGGQSSRDDKHNFDLIKVPEATKKGFAEISPGECFDAEHLSSSTRRGRKMENKSNTLMAKETDFMHYTPDFRIRRLTPIECARLQTIPDGYFINKETGKYIVSETQVYRQCGNGWTVDVIAYLLGFMNKKK